MYGTPIPGACRTFAGTPVASRREPHLGRWSAIWAPGLGVREGL
jgi:hypothetical protein